MSAPGRPVGDFPEIADFLSGGAEIHLQPGTAHSSSMVAKLAAAAGIGAMLTFAAPGASARDYEHVEDSRPEPASSLPRARAPPAADPAAPDATATMADPWTANVEAGPAPLPRFVADALGAGREPPAGPVTGPRFADLRPPMPDDLVFKGMRVPRHIAEAIVEASQETGADPVLMMAMADKESSFQPDIEANSSTAVGLFQFLEGTWLSVVKSYGHRHGLAREAAAISIVAGRPAVGDPAERQRILDLRREPRIASLMACELHLLSKRAIRQRIGEDPTPAESYLAHFMGPSGAGKFLEAVRKTPNGNAVRMFKEAAAANRNVFYDRASGRPRNLAQVRDLMLGAVQARVDRYADIEHKMGPTSPAPGR